MSRFVLVCLGGAVGTGARYLVSIWALRAFGAGFPYGTLIVNVLGSLLLGFLMQIGTTTEMLSPTMRLTLTTGVMGGFTTYSTFNYESTEYFRHGWPALGALNLAVTLSLCLIAGSMGIALGRLVTR